MADDELLRMPPHGGLEPVYPSLPEGIKVVLIDNETTLSVSTAALLVADAIEHDMTSFNAMLMASAATFSLDTPVRHYFATILREFAKLKKAEGDPNG